MAERINAKIISNRELKPGCFKMALDAPAVTRKARPGQFVHIRCGTGSAPFLRRPISIHRIEGRRIELLFDVVGEGTRILGGLSKGDRLDMLGPLGNGFEIPKRRYGLHVLIGGGLGAAPLLFLAEALAGKRTKTRRIAVVLGAKSRVHILCEAEFKALGADVYIATEDGTAGRKGLATVLAENVIKKSGLTAEKVLIYAAGPVGMIRALCGKSGSCSLRSQVSLEERMGCGLGACRGCVIRTHKGYKSVCKDGPVFRIGDII